MLVENNFWLHCNCRVSPVTCSTSNLINHSPFVHTILKYVKLKFKSTGVFRLQLFSDLWHFAEVTRNSSLINDYKRNNYVDKFSSKFTW